MDPWKPDAATLDAMLDGSLDDDGPWQWLVGVPDAAALWDGAVRRRRGLDLLACAIQGRPWLARAATTLIARAHPGGTPLLEAFVPVPELAMQLREAVVPPGESIELVWGALVPRPTLLGQTVALRARDPSTNVRCFYRRPDSDGPLPGAAWTLVAGEAPVLLLACLDVRDSSNIDAAIATAAAVAGVLLVEADKDGETDA